MKQNKLGETAEKTLQEKAEEIIEENIDRTQPSPVVLWWDRKGYLEPVIKEAAKNVGINFVKANRTPLELRKEGFSGNAEVWYVPQAKEGRDWFKDVGSLGGEIELAVHELAAELYEDLIAVDICEPENYEKIDKIGELLVEELTGRNIPNSASLVSKVHTQLEDPVNYVLKVGWNAIESKERKQKIIEALSKEVDVVSKSDSPESALKKTRKWFVAKWFVEEGLDKNKLPEEYRAVDSLNVKNNLKSLFNSNQRLEGYLEEYWPEIIDKTDIWKLKKCPVGGSLEKELWTEWKKLIENKKFEEAKEKASQREEILKEYYGETSGITKVWKISKNISVMADLTSYWEDVSGNDVFDMYSDSLWKIDSAARTLQSINGPSLNISHPARENINEMKEEWLVNYYKEYLSELAEYTEKEIKDGSFFKEHKHSFQFWEDKEDILESQGNKAIFYIDALRFDLAKELAEKLRELEEFEVEEESRIGCIPSVTKFGMNTLIPGDSMSFSLRLEETLTSFKNGMKINTTKRKEELRQKGWHVAEGYDGKWNHIKTTVFDQELDEIGEEDFENIEAKMRKRLEEVSKKIKELLKKGGFKKAFIVTDHGFMLMPKNYNSEGIHPPDNAKDVNRRWSSGNNLDPKVGVELDNDSLNYLEDSITLLINPYQRYRKQGISDERYFHGGGMPQEFILNFIEIDKK